MSVVSENSPEVFECRRSIGHPVATRRPTPYVLIAQLRGILATGLALASTWMAAADRALAETMPTFQEGVGRILAQHCVRCHNRHTSEGGLALDRAESFARGSDSGPVIVSGQPDESLLWQQVEGADPAMPKDGPSLTPDQLALLRTWIEQGASWPEGVELQTPQLADLDWWSLKPVHAAPAPASMQRDPWVRTPVDAFILQRLRDQGMTPADEADRRTLARRLYFDLIGLPPSPVELAAFIQDPHPLAYEQLVERLLASPRYGERWARHWLDVIHYGDTHGYDKDKPRPNAWPYRDYVVRSLNDDRPYERFVREQLAGDALWPTEAQAVIATGFIAAGPWDFIGHAEVAETKIDGQVARNLDRDDMVSSTLNTFISTTVQCARCHDHKFDPISQKHYYSLQAVFAALDRADRSVPGEASLRVYAGTVHQGEGTFRGTGHDGGRPRDIRVLHRGEVTQPGERVGPGALPWVPNVEWQFALAEDHPESARRVALADWLVHPDHPLTWRSIVNRIWLYHFGRGLVATPNDFGRMGQLPTHPELLDWLAHWFRDQGGSIKSLHRLLVTSSVYRQSSAHHPEHAATDADNQWLWRMNRRALDAECLRDTILCVSGQLRHTMYGPGFQDFVVQRPEHSPHYEYQLYDPADIQSHRRSIYRFLVRSQPQPMMQTLDCADPSQSVPQRETTITALQALTLLNNRFVLYMAEQMAIRLERDAKTIDGQVERACQLALGRQPTSDERRQFVAFAAQHGLPNLCRLMINLNEFAFVD
jgi:hypothetical protein